MRGFEHQDAEHKSDDVLAEEARQHVASTPSVQLVAELLVRLRALGASWWSPEVLRTKFPAPERMRWLTSRPDVRQRITSKLTGLAPKASRKKSPEFQAGLIDSVVDEGDVEPRELEEAFDPAELAVYGPAERYWNAFLELAPMDERARETEELLAWLIEALLASSGPGFTRKPILTPLDVRLALDGATWHTKVPLDVRVAIDRARLQAERERPEKPFGSADELVLATPAVLASSLSFRELAPVLGAAERAMGFTPRAAPSPAASSVSVPDPATVPVSVVAAPASSKPASIAPSVRASKPPIRHAPEHVGAVSRNTPVPAPPPTMPSAPPPALPPPPPSSARSAPPGSVPPQHRAGPVSGHPPSMRGGPPTTPPGMLPAPPPLQARASTPPHPSHPPGQPVGPSGTMPPGPPSSPAPAPSRRPPASAVPPAPPPPNDDGFHEVLDTELESTNPWETEGGADGAAPGLVHRGRPLRGN